MFQQAAADAGVKQFVFVSVHDYKAPQFVKRVGYFDGKRRTEKVVGELFGSKVKRYPSSKYVTCRAGRELPQYPLPLL